MRNLLLGIGLCLMSFHVFINQISAQWQFLAFAVGIVLLGIPHGAADLLVANKNAFETSKPFSIPQFLIQYLGRLLAFGVILLVFPFWGNVLFIFLAAYHFGETDLHQFKTETVLGKTLVTSYGLVILSVILIPNFDEVKQILLLYDASSQTTNAINWFGGHSNEVLFVVCLFFVVNVLLYFGFHKSIDAKILQLAIQLGFLLWILAQLPMVMGFTFYFVVWHSVLSLSNIIGYLQGNNQQFSIAVIVKQMVFYSSLAMGGIFIFALATYLFINNNVVMAYSFLGLAVLTAPHMQVMHEMYFRLRMGVSKV